MSKKQSQELLAKIWLEGRSPLVQDQILYTNLNLTQHQLKYAVIQKLASPPPSPKTGQIYFSTTMNCLRVYTTAGWTDFGQNVYVFTQSTPATTWNVQHNLGKLAPEVMVLDNTETQILTKIDFVDVNNLQIIFGRATAGTAYVQ